MPQPFTYHQASAAKSGNTTNMMTAVVTVDFESSGQRPIESSSVH